MNIVDPHNVGQGWRESEAKERGAEVLVKRELRIALRRYITGDCPPLDGTSLPLKEAEEIEQYIARLEAIARDYFAEPHGNRSAHGEELLKEIATDLFGDVE